MSLLGCHGRNTCIIYSGVSVTVMQLTGSRSFLARFKLWGLTVVVIHGDKQSDSEWTSRSSAALLWTMWGDSGSAMEDTVLTDGQEKPQKRVRFRVASGNSGRILKEMFKDEGPSDSLDSDCTSSSDADRASTPSTSGDVQGHLYGYPGSELDDLPDDLLVYAGATKDWTFTTKRVNILSKNGTVRGVRHKVSAGQTLFENLPGSNSVSIPDILLLLFLHNRQGEWRMVVLIKVPLKSSYSLELHVGACWDNGSPSKTRSSGY